jgi:hypothetical protein
MPVRQDFLVERRGFEPLTSALQRRRCERASASQSQARPHGRTDAGDYREARRHNLPNPLQSGGSNSG